MTPMLKIWTVYRNPRDYPDGYIARLFVIARKDTVPGLAQVVPTGEVVTGFTLDEVRNRLPIGLFNLGRQPGDDPCIVESWV